MVSENFYIPNNIPGYVAENSDVLDVIRVWDWRQHLQS